MPDTFARVRRGEKRPLFGQVAAETGTLTISASPAPTCTLYDAAGFAVSGLSNVAATGYDAGALAAPRVWFDLDTTSPTNLAAGFYTMVFKLSATGSDGIDRVLEPTVEVQVLDALA
jgi:hypothetical protein